IVVDSVNEKPTANPPGVTQSIPVTPPAEFEVADIKPSLGDSGQRARIQNGRVDIQGLPLSVLINIAWDLNPSGDGIPGAPKWLESARFDIVAKAPAEGTANGEQVDLETLRLMLQ